MNYPFDFYTAQSEQQQAPVTLASATTIVPKGFLSFVTGTDQIANITPPNEGGCCMVALVFTNANPGAFLNSGNIQATKDPAQNECVLLVYDPLTAKWYVVNP